MSQLGESPGDFPWPAFVENALQDIKDNFISMRELWRKIGIEGQLLKDRAEMALDHYNDLFTRMYEEDSNLLERIQNNLKDGHNKILQFTSELGLDAPQFTEGTPLMMERQITRKLDELENLRESRLTSLRDLRQQESLLCRCLDMQQYCFQDKKDIPTKQELEELEQQVAMLVQEKERRYLKYSVLRKDIVRLFRILGRSYSNPFEKEVCSEEPEDKDNINLSQDRIAAIKALAEKLSTEKTAAEQKLTELNQNLTLLWDCLKVDQDHKDVFLKANSHIGQSALLAFEAEILRCKELRRQNMALYVNNLREELVCWWDKCLASESNRNSFQAYYTSEEYSEELLKIHEQEVFRWKKMYSDFEGLFLKLNKHQKLFREMLDLEVGMNDPHRYTNRGGRLLQEERGRKRLLALIPQLETDLNELAEEYSKEVGEQFLVGGLPLVEYLNDQWTQYYREKENEKLHRKQRKMDEDISMTPSKRQKVLGLPSPFKTPNRAVGMSIRPHQAPTFTNTFRSPNLGASSITPMRTRKTPMASPHPKKLAVTPGLSVPTKTSTPRKNNSILKQQNVHLSTPMGPNCTTRNAASANKNRASPSSSMVSISYNSFMKSLNNPVREKHTRSTMVTNSSKKVLGSIVQPTFNNSGSKRRRSSGSKKHSSSVIRHGTKLKISTNNMPFRY